MTQPYYQDDFITLYHGDCMTEQTDWMHAAVLVTDPPYGISWRGGSMSTYSPKNIAKQQVLTSIAGDKTIDIRDAALAAWGDKPAIVFGSWRAERPQNVQHRLIWHKAGQAPGVANAAFMSQDEEIYILGKGFRRSSPPLRSVIRTTEARSVQVQQIGHPTPKPVGLMETLIDRCPEGLIADPFAGSGATLLAAKNLGRQVIGVELEEEYCEIIAKRCAQDVFDFGGL